MATTASQLVETELPESARAIIRHKNSSTTPQITASAVAICEAMPLPQRSLVAALASAMLATCGSQSGGQCEGDMQDVFVLRLAHGRVGRLPGLLRL